MPVMRFTGFSRHLVCLVVGLVIIGSICGVAADTASPPPTIQPTPAKLPPPGPRPIAAQQSRPHLRSSSNTVNRVISTNTTVQSIRTNVPNPSLKPVVLPDRFQRASVQEFDKLRTRPEAVVVDVRTQEEFADGHLPKAGLIDIKSKDFLATIAALDRSKLYLVNCAAGVRSVKACQSFAALGFTNVVNLDGGFTAWKKANPDAISHDPAIALPKSSSPNMQKSGTATTPPAAQAAPTNKNPVLKAPLINRKPAAQ